MKRRRPLAERFWEKVEVRSPDECWEWIAKARTSYGYGRMTNGRKVNLKSHRVSWMLAYGPIPDGMCVCHKCDNPSCCNPNHLFLGTKKENTHDMMRKGRMKFPPVMFGENHPNVTIADVEVEKIRTSPKTLAALAAEYGVSTQTIWRIKHRRTRAYEAHP